MHKLVALVPLVALFLPGCFTTIGAVVGSGHARSTNDELERRRATRARTRGVDVLDTAFVLVMAHSVGEAINNSPGWE